MVWKDWIENYRLPINASKIHLQWVLAYEWNIVIFTRSV